MEILQVVYQELLRHKDVQNAMTEIKSLFSFATAQDIEYELHQSDIAGFYNQVEHSRILQAVEFAVHQFCILQHVHLDSTLQTHTNKMERTLRTFRGHWRTQSKQYREIKLADIPALVQYLLNHSYFHVGVQVFKQHRGASMGSQWAPILCSAVALMQEHIFARVYPTLLSQPYFSNRYVDNRLLLIPCGAFMTSVVQQFWKLNFYTAPILLEVVDGQEALGFIVDPIQSTITYVQPWEKTLRSVRSSGTSRILKSGLLARLRLILNNVYPEAVRQAQVQDFLALFHMMSPTLFTPMFKNEIAMLCRQCRCFMSHTQMFRYAS